MQTDCVLYEVGTECSKLFRDAAGIRRVQQTRCKDLHFIDFCKTPYMFAAVFPSIIRSSKLHIQRQVFVRPILLPAASQYLSDRYCYLLLASICQTVTATCC